MRLGLRKQDRASIRFGGRRASESWHLMPYAWPNLTRSQLPLG
ncbi:hypothetical protein SPHS6_02222 [Sphingobium sp. S6]|nr:hypothetical protein SPHS8_01831 [Sphingobium sp. S8]CAD7338978.1 hypothetical protein SPHS6_02222 [Sphingobium sp. S6]